MSSPNTGRADVVWSAIAFAGALGSFTTLKPLREAIGVRGGLDDLPWLFTATFVAMTVLSPSYAVLAHWVRGPRLVVLVARTVSLVQLGLFLALHAWGIGPTTGAVFYVWVSVFNFVVVAASWSVLAQHHAGTIARGRFGPIAAGGSVAAILGPIVARGLAGVGEPTLLLLVSVACLELLVFAIRRLSVPPHLTDGDDRIEADSAEGPPRSAVPATAQSIEARGIRATAASFVSLLSLVCTRAPLPALLLYTVTSSTIATFLYAEQGRLVRAMASTLGERTSAFADVDLVANVFALVLQLFVVGRVLQRVGPSITLAITPLFAIGATGVLLCAPGAATLALAEGGRRSTTHGLARPAREVVMAEVDDELRFGAKGLVDTWVVRATDAAAIWLHATWVGFAVGTLGPSAGLWPVIGLGLVGVAAALRCRAPVTP